MKNIHFSILFILLFIPLISVEASVDPDTTAPVLTGFSHWPDTLDVTNGPDTLWSALSATDDLSGLASAQIVFSSPNVGGIDYLRLYHYFDEV